MGHFPNISWDLGGIVRRLHAAKALPSSFTAARLLSELGSGWAEDGERRKMWGGRRGYREK